MQVPHLTNRSSLDEQPCIGRIMPAHGGKGFERGLALREGAEGHPVQTAVGIHHMGGEAPFL